MLSIINTQFCVLKLTGLTPISMVMDEPERSHYRNTGRVVQGYRLTKRCELATICVNAKHHNIRFIPAQVGTQKRFTIRRDRQILRCTAQTRLNINHRKTTVVSDRIYRNTVVSAVTAIQITAVRRGFDISR